MGSPLGAATYDSLRGAASLKRLGTTGIDSRGTKNNRYAKFNVLH